MIVIRLLLPSELDWFSSSGHIFPLIERLPTTITDNTSNPNCPGASEVGLDKA